MNYDHVDHHLPTVERALPPLSWGWYAVCFTRELQAGEIKPVHYFERDLIVFRTESGLAAVLDAHCPHLGANLGIGGTVVGESVRCPFHHWRFDADGSCVEVPLCDKIPPKAKARAYPVVEQGGLIYMWFHPTEDEPLFELRPVERQGWTDDQTIRWRIHSHPQEVAENTVDIAHMRPVHSTKPSRVKHGPEADGYRMSLLLNFVAPGEIVGMEGENDVELGVEMSGLGQIQAEAWVEEAGVRARYRICCTPIDRETIDIYTVVNVQEMEDPEFTAEVAELFFKAYTTDFVKDFPIWENKKYYGRPVLSAADGPIGTFRKWARQFHLEEFASGRERAGAGRPRPQSRPQDAPHVAAERLTDRVRASALGLFERVRSAVPIRFRPEEASTSSVAAGASGGAAKPGNGPSRPGAPASRSGASEPPPTKGHRVADLDEYFATLERRFVPAAAKGVDAVFQWEIGDVTYHAVVKDGAMELCEGAHTSPTVTIAMKQADDYIQVVNGEMNGTRAFTSGKGKVRGQVRMAMKMRHIFPQA